MFRYINHLKSNALIRSLMLVMLLFAMLAVFTMGCAEPEDPLEDMNDEPAPGGDDLGGGGDDAGGGF